MTLLIGLAARSSVMLAVGLLLSACLARRSAALRHGVLAVAVLAAAAVAPIGLALPEWTVTLPAWSAAEPAPPPDAGPAPVATPAAAPAAEPPAPAAAVPLAPRPSRREPLSPFIVVWIAGVFVAAGTLAAGLVRVGRLAARASPIEDGEWTRALEAVAARYGLTRRVVLARTESADLVAAWGLRRPTVLLPHHARNWPPDRVHVVLCHELAHIRRHDWIVQLAAETLRAVLWFNPLAWMACARLRREGEQACDDHVLGQGVGGQEYAVHLLDLAKQCRRLGHAPAAATPMAHPSTLERRIAAMLDARLDRRGLSRRALAAIGAVLLLVTVPVAALHARQERPTPQVVAARAPVPVRAETAPVLPVPAIPVKDAVRAEPVRPAAVPSAPSPAAKQADLPLSGTVYDVTGAVLPGVTVTLVDASQAKRSADTNAAGRFEFPAVAQGRYTLQVSLPGFRTLRDEILLQNPRDRDRSVMLQIGQLMETVVVSASRVAASTEQPSVRAEPQRIRVGGNVRPPRKELDVKPVYPASMREAGLTGIVPIEALIGRDGTVVSARVLTAQIHPDFAIAAVDAVRQWRFTPTLLNGVAVEVVMTVSVQFALND